MSLLIYSIEPKNTHMTIHNLNAVHQNCASAKSKKVLCASIAFFDNPALFILSSCLLFLENSTTGPSKPLAGYFIIFWLFNPPYILKEETRLTVLFRRQYIRLQILWRLAGDVDSV